MLMDYFVGLLLGFVHGLLAAYVVLVLNRNRRRKNNLPDDLF